MYHYLVKMLLNVKNSIPQINNITTDELLPVYVVKHFCHTVLYQYKIFELYIDILTDLKLCISQYEKSVFSNDVICKLEDIITHIQHVTTICDEFVKFENNINLTPPLNTEDPNCHIQYINNKVDTKTTKWRKLLQKKISHLCEVINVHFIMCKFHEVL